MTTADISILERLDAAVDALDDTGFPVEVFPARLQSLVRRMMEVNGLSQDFLCPAILGAAAIAIGNSLRVYINGAWSANPNLYLLLVGDPGTGKTPAANAVLRTILERDSQRVEQYRRELEAYRAQKSDDAQIPKPRLQQILFSDFTPEALLRSHSENLRGVAISGDEARHLFDIANRYNSSQMNTQLLSAWSGQPIQYNRVSIDVPLRIDRPSICILGTIQTSLIPTFLQSGECLANGMLDRLLFAFPKHAKAIRWTDDYSDMTQAAANNQAELDSIISTLLKLEYDPVHPVTLKMSPEARSRFVRLHNEIAEQNEVKNFDQKETRDYKLDGHIARFSLILQALRWACDEAELNEVDLISLEGALRINDYFQDCYHRLMAIQPQSSSATTSKSQAWLSQLADTFTTAEALQTGERLKIPERTVKRWIGLLTEKGVLTKFSHGQYTRVRNGNDNGAESTQIPS